MSVPGADGLTELDDRWLLPFRGLAVTRIVVGVELGLVLGGDCGVSIAGTAVLGWAASGVRPATVELHPGRQGVAAGQGLVSTAILSAVAFKSGSLRLVFDDGHLLKVASDPGCEAWKARGPDGLLVVSMPGGSLAVWSPRS